MNSRLFSTCTRLANRQTPRFVNTLKEAAKPALQKPEPVTKPFGFDSRIEIDSSGSIANVFGKESSERRQRQLDHDIKHSAFYESKSFQNTKGKIFSSPVSYFKRDKSKFFPGFTGYTLLNEKKNLYEMCKDKVTILRIFSTISGENCTNSFVEQYLTEEGYAQFQKKYPTAQIVDVNIPQSWIKGLFVTFAKSNLRKLIAPARHNQYFIVPNKLFGVDVKRELKCDNSCSGYLYVLDGEGHIRWAASGPATDAESEVLWKAVAGIEREQKN